jgi:hypothetical protein
VEKQAFFDGFYSGPDGLPIRRIPSEKEAITPAEHADKFSVTTMCNLVAE